MSEFHGHVQKCANLLRIAETHLKISKKIIDLLNFRNRCFFFLHSFFLFRMNIWIQSLLDMPGPLPPRGVRPRGRAAPRRPRGEGPLAAFSAPLFDAHVIAIHHRE